jgi:hypothetical protein
VDEDVRTVLDGTVKLALSPVLEDAQLGGSELAYLSPERIPTVATDRNPPYVVGQPCKPSRRLQANWVTAVCA